MPINSARWRAIDAPGTAPSSATADSGVSVVVTALNQFNAKVAGYTGIVTFTSSDAGKGKAITLPVNHTFTGGDAGTHTFAGVKLETAGHQTIKAADAGSHTFATPKLETVGRQTITVTDTAKGAISGTRAIIVTPGIAKTLLVTAPKGVVAAGAFNVTITARDAGGNTATGYTGSVTFTSTDGGATLPADYTFLSGDNGKHVFSVTLAAVGNKTVTATDKTTGSINGTSPAIKVH